MARNWRRWGRWAGTSGAAAAVVAIVCGVAPPGLRGRGAVAADQEQASAAGVEILIAGGNAMDAAVAAALVSGVVQPSGAGLGGGGFAVWVDGAGPENRHVLDFREVAPASATMDQFRRPDGSVDREGSLVGGRAVAVPGESRGLALLARRHGKLDLKQIAAPAIAAAEKGFPVGPRFASRLSQTKHEAVKALWSSNGVLPRERDVVKRPELGKVLRRWAATGGEDLHTGASAAAIVAAVKSAGGSLTADDLAGYAPKERAPIVVPFRGKTVVTMPPPSSGGLCLGQMLLVLDGYDLENLDPTSADYLQLLAEAMKHAYADRAHKLGDPDVVDVQMGAMLSDARVAEVRSRLWPGRTHPPEYYGPLLSPPEDHGTGHISVVDMEGNAVALTHTINASFGSGVVVKELGISLNNEMDDFAIAPGVPNTWGLVGSERNAIAPGKRPLSSMSPTIVLDENGAVSSVLGASGGGRIISSTLQVLLDVEVYAMDPQAAVAAPRIHHQWLPDELEVEPGFGAETAASLQMRGHKVVRTEAGSAVQVVVVRDGMAITGADPRLSGRAAATW